MAKSSLPAKVSVDCPHCGFKQLEYVAAKSTMCRQCGSSYAPFDLKDYKITTSFSRTIRTQGEVHLTAKGDLTSTSVICRSALIEGKLRGNLQCSDSATINFIGKIPGRLIARHVVLESKADVQFFRRLRVGSIQIRGRMSGEIIADSEVAIQKGGSLDGDVTARSISVEKGGMFSGQLIIGQRALTQGELLPVSAASAPPSTKAAASPMVAQPLPTTS